MHVGPAVAIALSVLTLAPPADLPDRQATHLDSYRWQGDEDWFGGFSGLSLSADGLEMTVISDRGLLLTARIERQDGRITGIDADPPISLRKGGNGALVGERADAEGLAMAPDGSICVSFELSHRIGCYETLGEKATVLPDVREFRQLHENRSLEALAIDAQGAIYTIPERPARDNGELQVFRYDATGWSVPFTIPRIGSFLPVGADFGPDGRFYVLERAIWVFGFRSRVRSWQIEHGRPTRAKTVLLTYSGKHDNLEGLSVWRDDQGDIRLTMISDDNFKFFQRTELVEYVLKDPLASSPASR